MYVCMRMFAFVERHRAESFYIVEITVHDQN